jgi:cell division protein FtsI/penicillin-binding protein 2
LDAADVTHALGEVTRTGSSATAAVSSRFTLPGIGTWNVQSTVNLVDRSGRWLVDWSPSAIQPALQTGDHLELTRTWAPRAPILGARGAPLTAQGPVVVVGIEGSRIKDPSAVSATLIAAGATAADVHMAATGAAAHPAYFEPVFQLTEARYQQLGGDGSALYKIPGTVFRHTSARTVVTPGLAAHLVGSVGPITAQQLQQLGGSYDSASVVGQTGLEAAYEKQLAGTPGGAVTIVGADGVTRLTVATFSPHAGTELLTGIDPTVEQAAESALASVSNDAALVAVRASTGQVLAAVSDPASAPFDQALEGEFPPGSTFKVITSTALIEAGLSPSSAATCPPSVTVDGETFHNAEGDAPASTFAQAFAESCNTAFIGMVTAAHLQPDSLPEAASLYDIGATPSIGLEAFGGSVPTPPDAAALAATAIGQGAVVVSPLSMAMVASAVASGTVREPRLVVGTPDDTAPTHPLPLAVDEDLREMMAAVVATGTAAGTGLPAGTYAKTGTAQYGTGKPQRTDAWLIGYRGDIAFAIVVQGTGNGGPTDGPIIARFLQALGPDS